MSDHFSLKHSNHFGDMFKVFEEMYHNRVMSDVVISCIGSHSTISAHRIVLAAGSDFFRQTFADLPPPFAQHPMIIAVDIEHEVLEALIEFLYRGQIVVQKEKLDMLRVGALNLKIKGLEAFLRKNFAANATVEKRAQQNLPQVSNKRARLEADFGGENVEQQYAMQPSMSSFDVNAMQRAYAQLFNNNNIININNEIESSEDDEEDDEEEEEHDGNVHNFASTKYLPNKSAESGEDEACGGGGGEDDEDVNADDIDNRFGGGSQDNNNNNLAADNNLQLFALMAAQYGLMNSYDHNLVNNMLELASGGSSSFNPFGVSSALANFNEHQKQQAGLGKHNVCDICGKTYAWKSGLYKHKRQMHSIITKTSGEAEAAPPGGADTAANDNTANADNFGPVDLSTLLPPAPSHKQLDEVAPVESAESNAEAIVTEQSSN